MTLAAARRTRRLRGRKKVVVSMGKGYVEVRPKGVNKGAIVDHIISQLYTHSGGVDFVLCIGDDSADEFMFQANSSPLVTRNS